MKHLIDYIKGFLVGLANVVAGLSGGTVAVILNVYDDMLDLCSNVITHLFSQIKKHYRLIIGILLGLIIGAFALKKLYEVIPLPITGFFAGLVFFSLLPLAKGLSFKKNNTSHLIELVIPFILLIALPLMSAGAERSLSLGVANAFIAFGLGIIAALAMVLPGVSGSMVLLVLGYYTPVLTMITDLMKFNNFKANLVMTIIFALGAIFGLVVGSKAIKKLMSKAPMAMNFIIYGLIAGSTIGMLITGVQNNNALISKMGWSLSSYQNILMHVFGVLLFILGVVIGYFVEKISTRKANNMDLNNLNIKDFEALSEKYFDSFKNTLKELVKFPSVLDEYKEGSNEPFGKANREALEYMLNVGKKDGFETLNCDNYAGHIQFGNGEETLGLLAHLDVVPVTGQKWDNDPFTVVEKDGKLIGRGVNDDKGPLLASYYAIKILADLGFKPNKAVKLIMGCDEESGSRCLEHYFKYNPMPTIGFSPDACFPCINGEKAHANFDIVGNDDEKSIIETFVCGERYNIVPAEAHMTLTKDLKNEYLEFLKKNNYNGEVIDNTYYAYGVGAHAMTPEKGFNAAFVLFSFLDSVVSTPLTSFVTKYISFDPFGQKLSINKEYSELGKLTENMGLVRIENGTVRLGFDMRVPSDEMESLIKTNVCEALKGTLLKIKDFDFTKVHYVPKDSFLVQALVKSYQEATGDYSHGAYSIGGGTYAKFMPSAVAFGPQFIGREDVDHQANEYIYESDYKKIIAIYAKSIYDLTR